MIMRLISIILAVLLLSTCPVYALTPPNLDSPQDEGPYILCAESDLSNFASWPYVKSVIILEPNEAIHIMKEEGALINALPLQMAYVCESGTTIDVDVVWDISDGTLLQSGLHQVIGYPVIDGEKILLAEGYDGKVTWPVFRKGGEPLEAVPLQKPLLTEPLIPLNGDLTELSISTSGRSWGVGSDGIIKSDDSWVWTWDYTEIDISREGRYTLTGTLEPPEWISADDADRLCQHTVYVLPDNRIEIYAACELLVTYSKGQISTGDLVIKWLYDSSNVTEAVLQYVDDNGLWTDCDNSWYRYDPPSKFSPAKIRLRLLEIPSGAEHSLRLRYNDMIDGEPTERFTMSIMLIVSENIMEILEDADGGIPAELDIGGDRDEDDFGDQGKEPPHGDIIPPAEPPVETFPDTENDSTSGDEVRPPENMFPDRDFWWPIVDPEDDAAKDSTAALPEVTPADTEGEQTTGAELEEETTESQYDENVSPSEPSTGMSSDREDDVAADSTVVPPEVAPVDTEGEQTTGAELGEETTESQHDESISPSDPPTGMSSDKEDDAAADSTFGVPGDTSADTNIKQRDCDTEDNMSEQETKQPKTYDTSETTVDHSSAETNIPHNDDESVTELTRESEPFRILDAIILILGISVLGGILCIWLLCRKKEKT